MSWVRIYILFWAHGVCKMFRWEPQNRNFSIKLLIDFGTISKHFLCCGRYSKNNKCQAKRLLSKCTMDSFTCKWKVLLYLNITRTNHSLAISLTLSPLSSLTQTTVHIRSRIQMNRYKVIHIKSMPYGFNENYLRFILIPKSF